MIIDYSNRNLLHSFCFSDSIFEGFIYNYGKDILSFSCINPYEHRQFHISFYQVTLLNMQSCNFWGAGNAIYDISYTDDSSMLTQLQILRSENHRNIDKSKLDIESDYLSISVSLNSGDELLIVCKYIDLVCEEMR